MVTRRKNVFGCAANFLRGKKCVFCGSFKVSKTARGYVRCRNKTCGKQKSLKRIRMEMAIVRGFYQQQPAYRLATDLDTDYKTITRVYQKLREAIYHVAELEGKRLSGKVEMDESYFGGRRRGSVDVAPRAKTSFLAFWSAMGRSIHGWWSMYPRKN